MQGQEEEDNENFLMDQMAMMMGKKHNNGDRFGGGRSPRYLSNKNLGMNNIKSNNPFYNEYDDYIENKSLIL